MSNYTTTDNVRSEAGFNQNANITDAEISRYITQAHAEVVGMVGGVYLTTNLDISNTKFNGSQAHEYLRRSEELMAAGYLLWRQYGAQGIGKDSNGNELVAEGRALIQALYRDTGGAPARLFDTDGAEFERVDASTSGLPTVNTARDPIFKINSDIT